ncbi:MAG: hypothetical protein IPK00_27590 [Deltaproteobacteria bacterium]|nr:hypothetical protein [Deltaproteobacteria bacterium]
MLLGLGLVTLATLKTRPPELANCPFRAVPDARTNPQCHCAFGTRCRYLLGMGINGFGCARPAVGRYRVERPRQTRPRLSRPIAFPMSGVTTCEFEPGGRCYWPGARDGSDASKQRAGESDRL